MNQAGKIFELIPKIMEEIGAIGKTQTNAFQKYKFRGIDDVLNRIHPVFAKHGVFVCPNVLNAEHREVESKDKISFHATLRVAFRFYACDGSFIEAVTEGEGLDSSDKASNKAMSAALKYAVIQTFFVPTDDIEDSDRDSPQAGRVRHKITNVTKVGNNGGL